MKPIKLSVAGLHSFREKQEVDFETLCSGGVFGIFGPTGSGKSSILDAMTLALYGKVERASNNTQGVMNHAEKQLSVSFTFELANAKRAKRYRVERTFKRTDEIRMKTAICRLVEEGEESIVLADKANDVNEKIHELLGLTIDDFTRAVVLPQGKFAEFLSLKGSERRQMLQRLFHLEKYGDKLTKKLKHRLQKANGTYQELVAEQTGLGDASKEALDLAKEVLNEKEKELLKMEQEYERFTLDFEEKAQVWQWMKEKAALEKKQEDLKQQRPMYEKMAEALKKAEEAERLKPYAETVCELKKERDGYKSVLIDLTNKLTVAKQDEAKRKESFEKARENRSENEPILLKRKEKLHQLNELLAEYEKEQEGYKELEKQVANHQLALHKAEEERLKAEDVLKRAIEKQAKLKEDRKELQMSKEERDRIHAAWQKKQLIVRIEDQWDECKKQLEKREHALKQYEADEKKFDHQVNELEGKLSTQFSAILSVYNRVSERLREAEMFANWLKKKIKDVEEEVDHARVRQIATELSNELKDGKPCPVCGSTHHPNPQVVTDSSSETITRLQSELHLFEQMLEQLRLEAQHIHSLKLKLEDLSELVVKEYPRLSKVQEELAVSIEPLVKWGDLANEVEPNQLLNEITAERKGLEQDVIAVKEAYGKTHEWIRDVVEKKHQIKPLIKAMEQEIDELTEKEKEWKEKVERAQKEWRQHYPQMAMEEVETAIDEFKKKEELFDHLTERIEKSVTFIEEQQEKKKALMEKEHEHSRLLSGKLAELNVRKQSLNDKEARLKAEVDEETNIQQELQKVVEMMEKLKEEEQKAYDKWQEVLEALQRLERDVHSVKRQLESTEEKLKKANIRWEEEREASPFDTIELVLTSLLPHDEKKNLREKIETYKEQMQEISSALFNIEEKRKGRTLTEEEWTALQTKKQTLQSELNELIAEKGAKETQLKIISEKHERYMEIEKEKQTLEKQIEQLTKLQSVFKGNSFVEYIAEEQLQQVSLDASERLGQLTRRRYAIEVDSQGGFVIRDDANGGVKRPVSTLSGGETFLTSLALALSLSAQIQLRGQYPLQFFFLDEGFGTLDAELLDTVVSALEKLQSNNLSVGVISHVQELRARLPKRLVVERAEPSGRGTRVRIETL